MNVLVITGDKKFGPGNERYDLQRSVVDRLEVIYWGRGAVWPRIPSGAFDVVTAQDPLLRGAFALYAAKLKSARANIQVHMDLQSLSWWKHILAQLVLRHADSIRVVSKKLKRQVEHIGVSAPITVLPVYVDTLRFSSIVRMPHSAKNILWIGRFEDEKDPLAALKIVTEVSKVIPDAILVMLGEGNLRGPVEEQAKVLPNVRLVGWQNPMQYLDTADVLLCTSKHESYGATIVEALAAGVPVVAPDVGVAEEAGATVVLRSELATAVIEALLHPTSAHLRLPGLTRDEWARAWVASLL